MTQASVRPEPKLALWLDMPPREGTLVRLYDPR